MNVICQFFQFYKLSGFKHPAYTFFRYLIGGAMSYYFPDRNRSSMN